MLSNRVPAGTLSGYAPPQPFLSPLLPFLQGFLPSTHCPLSQLTSGELQPLYSPAPHLSHWFMDEQAIWTGPIKWWLGIGAQSRNFYYFCPLRQPPANMTLKVVSRLKTRQLTPCKAQELNQKRVKLSKQPEARMDAGHTETVKQ